MKARRASHSFAAVLLSLFLGCVSDAPELGASSEAIASGTLGGNDSVVLIVNFAGGLCTGAVIAPRVVLTAKHCIQGNGAFAAPPTQFRVFVGESLQRRSAEYAVQEVRPAPGCWNLCGDASDVAVMILSTAAREAPLPMNFEDPADLAATEITAIGYGETAAGESGRKYTTSARVSFVGPAVLGLGARIEENIIAVNPSVCQGDSGGPMIDAQGNVRGVVSFGANLNDPRNPPACGQATGFYNGIAALEEFILAAIEDSGSCAMRGDEVCNGIDDDCDDELDEGCTPLGGLCTTDDECVGGTCVDSPAGRICSRACDPLRPEAGCFPDAYCARTTGCDGACVPKQGVEATLGVGAACTSDAECHSLFCSGEGELRRCLSACQGDVGSCISGEVCAALPGECGACVSAAERSNARGLGEPCGTNDDCISGGCFSEEGLSYCTRACTGDADCGAGYHCRGQSCVRGPRGQVGAGCVTSEDCIAGAACAVAGERSWCSVVCTGDADCPGGFSCQSAGAQSICVPDRALVGEPCAASEDCLSGLCATTAAGSVCTRICGPDAFCSAGFECVRSGDGVTAVCARPTPPARDPGGCGVSTGRGFPSLGLGLLLLGFGALFRRRSRR
ncbi:MAG: S1 family peptidase [Myxococcota bacterium]